MPVLAGQRTGDFEPLGRCLDTQARALIKEKCLAQDSSFPGILIKKPICFTVSGCLGTFGAVQSSWATFMTLKTSFRRVNYQKGGRFQQNARLGQVWAGELAALIWQPFRMLLKPKTSKVRTCFGVQSTKRKVVNITAVVQTMSFMLEFVPKKCLK